MQRDARRLTVACGNAEQAVGADNPGEYGPDELLGMVEWLQANGER